MCLFFLQKQQISLWKIFQWLWLFKMDANWLIVSNFFFLCASSWDLWNIILDHWRTCRYWSTSARPFAAGLSRGTISHYTWKQDTWLNKANKARKSSIHFKWYKLFVFNWRVSTSSPASCHLIDNFKWCILNWHL